MNAALQQLCLPDGVPFDRDGNPRKRFVSVVLDGSHCALTPEEAEQFKLDAARSEPETQYEYREVTLSQQEYDALPEFDGF